MHRLNHMQMTFPRGTFTDEWFADLRTFYGGIFGWHVTRTAVTDGPSPAFPHIYMYLDEAGQEYLVLSEEDHPMQTMGNEHLGIITERPEEVGDLLDACRRHADKDSRVAIRSVVEHMDAGAMASPFEDGWTAPYLVSGFNVAYLMPVSWDVAHDTYKPGQEPPRRWHYG